MMTLRAIAGLAAGCLFVAACGAADSKDPVASQAPTSTTTTPTDGASRSDGSQETGPGAGGADVSPEEAPKGDETTDATSAGGGSQPLSGEPPGPTGIVTSISPLCAGQGDAARVVVETDPLADVSYAIAFADGDSGNLFGLAQADLAGKFVWNFVVPADAATGDADVIVTSAHPDKGGKTGQGTIRVTESGACP